MYGLQSETVDSIVLDLLPSVDHKYLELTEDGLGADSTRMPDIWTFIIQEILTGLKNNSGFHIPEVTLALYLYLQYFLHAMLFSLVEHD